MDANSIFRMIVGILVVLAGLGWSAMVVLAAMMADGDPDPGSTWRAFLGGLVAAAIGVVILALPLFFH